MYKFTFVIPVYDDMPYIQECIESILNQEYKNFNIVVLHHGGNNATLEYLNTIDSKLPITIFSIDNTLTIEENWARIVDVDAHEFMIIAGSDDRFYPNYLTEISKQIDTCPDASIYRTYVDIINEFSAVISDAKPLKLKYTYLTYLKERLTHEYFETAQGYCFRTKDYKALGGIDCVHGLMHTDDKLIMELARLSYLSITPVCACSYRSHSKSASASSKAEVAIAGYNYFFNWIYNSNDKEMIEIVRKYLPVHLKEIRGFFDKDAMLQQYEMCTKYNIKIKNIYYRIHKLKRKHHLYSQNEPKNFVKALHTKDKINICFATDENYFRYMLVAIISIIKSADRDDFLNFYILCNNVSSTVKAQIDVLQKIRPFNYTFIDIDASLFADCPSMSNYISITTYFRYKIAELLPHLDKIIYLDCDIIVKRSLYSLFNTNIENYAVAGVEDVGYRHWKDETPNPILIDNYINAGVLLINIEMWRKEKIADLLFEYTAKNKDTITHADQDIINMALHTKCLLLDYKWNVQDSFYRDCLEVATNPNARIITEAVKNPGIIHYTGPIKPWKSKKVSAFKDWYNSAKLLKSFSSRAYLFLLKRRSKLLKYFKF